MKSQGSNTGRSAAKRSRLLSNCISVLGFLWTTIQPGEECCPAEDSIRHEGTGVSPRGGVVEPGDAPPAPLQYDGRSRWQCGVQPVHGHKLTERVRGRKGWAADRASSPRATYGRVMRAEERHEHGKHRVLEGLRAVQCGNEHLVGRRSGAVRSGPHRTQRGAHRCWLLAAGRCGGGEPPLQERPQDDEGAPGLWRSQCGARRHQVQHGAQSGVCRDTRAAAQLGEQRDTGHATRGARLPFDPHPPPQFGR